MKRILLLENDLSLGETIKELLLENNYEVGYVTKTALKEKGYGLVII